MAEVYKMVGNKSIEEFMAKRAEVQRGLGDVQTNIYFEARATLDAHRHEGHTKITMERGDVDRYVHLNDDRGQGAAMSIELGHARKGGGERVKGLFILSDAARKHGGNFVGGGR